MQIYGTINAEYGVVSAPDSTPNLNNFDGFDSGASNIGFKGEEKLGGGMSAWFQWWGSAKFREKNQACIGASGASGRTSSVPVPLRRARRSRSRLLQRGGGR